MYYLNKNMSKIQKENNSISVKNSYQKDKRKNNSKSLSNASKIWWLKTRHPWRSRSRNDSR